MIVTLLNSRGSCKWALDYSERKVDRLVASVQAVRNLPDDIPMVIYDTLLEYERNPRAAKQMRDFRFHMAVSPGPGDRIDREGCVRLIDELMEKAGFGDQPYVIYRHNDIEREHFHVVSVRVDREGRAIYGHYDARRMMAFCRELEEEYGFRIGCESCVREDEAVGLTESFDPALGNMYAQMREAFASACSYSIRDERQLAEVLRQKNLLYKTARTRRGETVVVLQGLGRDGRPVTRPVSAERQLGIQGAEMMREALSRAPGGEEMRFAALRAESLMRQAAPLTPTAAHFVRALSQLGLTVSFRRGEDYPQAIDGGYVTDTTRGMVFSLDELSPELTLMLREMETGTAPQWKRASRMESGRLATAEVLTPEQVRGMDIQALNEYNARTFGAGRTAGRSSVPDGQEELQQKTTATIIKH